MHRTLFVAALYCLWKRRCSRSASRLCTSSDVSPVIHSPISEEVCGAGWSSRNERTQPLLLPRIGTITTPFQSCRGIPRQGNLAPSTEGVVTLINASACDMDELRAHSHVVVTVLCHMTNGFDYGVATGHFEYDASVRPPGLRNQCVGELLHSAALIPPVVGGCEGDS